MRTIVPPDEDNAPLVVDTDAVLPGPVALQKFKAVAGWSGEVTQLLSVVQLSQFALGNALDIRSNPTREAAMKQSLGVPIGEPTPRYESIASAKRPASAASAPRRNPA